MPAPTFRDLACFRVLGPDLAPSGERIVTEGLESLNSRLAEALEGELPSTMGSLTLTRSMFEGIQ